MQTQTIGNRIFVNLSFRVLGLESVVDTCVFGFALLCVDRDLICIWLYF